MTSQERGFLLLRSRLGDRERRPLTQAQLQKLRQMVLKSGRIWKLQDLTLADLIQIGCTFPEAQRIFLLLEDEERLDCYIGWGAGHGCEPITQRTWDYPRRVMACLRDEAPGCLWAKGDRSILQMNKVALVGSRDLLPTNARFAQSVGRFAAYNGLALVSGNARGADKTAQEACLAAGGKVISVVADTLYEYPERENVLYLSEESYDEDFTACRALSRNRVIHSLGEITFVAQCGYGKGGTWDGTTRNLRNRWSRVMCFRDGSPAMQELANMGAELVEGPPNAFPRGEGIMHANL